ncbi:terminase small subunit [Geminicoccus harenae]|uniref:terminase small subunit n=1 Tax=Geminicoccus harenae TaxID=2498453 RepID=UPI00168B7FD9|nr:terminase small subunit [Geminicoccus harenae]
MTRPLNAKQLRFVEEYLCDLNGTQAAIRAGYAAKWAESTARDLLQDPRVTARVTELQEQRSKQSEITAEWIVGRIREVAERCMQAVPVRDRKGNPVLVDTPTGEVTPAYTFDSAGANKALELLGKYRGIFTEKHVVTGRYVIEGRAEASDMDEWLRSTSAGS